MNARSTVTLLALLLPAITAAAQKTGNDKPALKSSPSPRVELVTSKGRIVLELNPGKAPASVKNFLQYVKDDYYDGTIFHRVIDSFMIQGGGFELEDGSPTQKQPGKPIKNEGKNGLKNKRGTVAMARTSNPDSATSQFFINVVDNPGLDFPRPDGHGYAVFGKVVEGMDIVDKIRKVRTGMQKLKVLHPSGQHRAREMPNVPHDHVVIKSARILPPENGKQEES